MGIRAIRSPQPAGSCALKRIERLEPAKSKGGVSKGASFSFDLGPRYDILDSMRGKS